MVGGIQEYYNLYYKGKNERLSSAEKKRLNELSYQKAMKIRKCTPRRYGLMLIGVAYEEFLHYYNHPEKFECTTLLYLIDKLKIRIGEICSIYSLSKGEVRDYFESILMSSHEIHPYQAQHDGDMFGFPCGFVFLVWSYM